MIAITETALSVLSEGLRASGVEQGRGLRLKEQGDRLTLALDRPRKGDRVVASEGQTVLIIAPAFEARIGDAVIDAEDTAEGAELVMRSVEQP